MMIIQPTFPLPTVFLRALISLLEILLLDIARVCNLSQKQTYIPHTLALQLSSAHFSTFDTTTPYTTQHSATTQHAARNNTAQHPNATQRAMHTTQTQPHAAHHRGRGVSNVFLVCRRGCAVCTSNNRVIYLFFYLSQLLPTISLYVSVLIISLSLNLFLSILLYLNKR